MSDRIPLSVIVCSFNEEQRLGDCLASVAFADDLVVVDSFSTDATVEVAKRHGARVLQHEFWSQGAQSNWAMPQAAHDWVLIVDADERVTPELGAEIREILQRPACDGYWVHRRNFFLGREIKHGTWAGDTVLRLFRRDKGRYVEQHVHSRVQVNGTEGHCRGSLLHYSYSCLEDYARKTQRFSRGGALDAQKAGKRSGPGTMLIHGLGRFFKGYILKRGFLDGTEGLIIAAMEAEQGFLKYAKLWELQRQPRQSPRQP